MTPWLILTLSFLRCPGSLCDYQGLRPHHGWVRHPTLHHHPQRADLGRLPCEARRRPAGDVGRSARDSVSRGSIRIPEASPSRPPLTPLCAPCVTQVSRLLLEVPACHQLRSYKDQHIPYETACIYSGSYLRIPIIPFKTRCAATAPFSATGRCTRRVAPPHASGMRPLEAS